VVNQRAEFETHADAPKRGIYQNIGFVLGPLLAVIIWMSPAPTELGTAGWNVIAMALWMAAWWATEAVPMPATSLLPLIILPLSGVTDVKGASLPYSSPIIYLLMGGFIIAMAMQRWNLHRRIALMILANFGSKPSSLIGGFMVAAAFLSMWVSNTATTLMMVPIALSLADTVVGDDHPRHPFILALLLAIAYAASIGGMGTPVGTPPNLLVVAYMAETLNVEISFASWMAFGVPVVATMIPAAWFVLTKLVFKVNQNIKLTGGEMIREELAKMGPMSTPEKRVAMVFLLVAFSWMFRLYLIEIEALQNLTDMGIAVMGAVIMFIIPSGSKDAPGTFLLDWDWAVRIPWGVGLLFGGGLSLAAAITSSGLAIWLGDSLAVLTTWHILAFMGVLVTLVVFLTELTSNTATVAALLPILGAVAIASGIDPMLLAAPAAIAASCAFMLPVATGPNATIFAGGRIQVPDMVRAGFRINIIAIFLVTSICYLMVPIIFG